MRDAGFGNQFIARDRNAIAVTHTTSHAKPACVGDPVIARDQEKSLGASFWRLVQTGEIQKQQ